MTQGLGGLIVISYELNLQTPRELRLLADQSCQSQLTKSETFVNEILLFITQKIIYILDNCKKNPRIVKLLFSLCYPIYL
jgi:hypothetical protein